MDHSWKAPKAKHTVRCYAPHSPWKKQLYVFEQEDEHRCCRSRPPPSIYNLQAMLRKLLEPVQRKSSIVFRVLMKGMAKWRNDVQVAAGQKHPCQFAHDPIRFLHMFKHGIALDTLKNLITEGQELRVGSDVHAAKQEYSTLMYPSGFAPAPPMYKLNRPNGKSSGSFGF